MAKKRGYYEGVDQRRKMEKMDGEMIGTGFGYYANMPDQPVVKLYPKPYIDDGSRIDDGLKGIDTQIAKDERVKKRKEQPEKY